MHTITSFSAAREALRNRQLRQALYDEGQRLMGPVIVNLHGAEHTARRRLENRLFSPETISYFEAERLPEIIAATIDRFAPDDPSDTLDVVPLARRAMMRLSLDVAGIDLPGESGNDNQTGESGNDNGTGESVDAAFDGLFAIMHRLATASVVVHATGDKQAIIDDGDRALAAFERQYYRPSLERRAALLEADAPLPRDILSTLLAHRDQLDLSPDDMLREVAYFPWVGSHSTATQFVHALHHVLTWIGDHPADRERLIDDDAWRLRFVHESLRLHPASPIAVRRAVESTSVAGRTVASGEIVTISVEAANRDRDTFGDAPDRFDPDRAVADDATRWGLSFGSGMHACVGRELAAGRESTPDAAPLQGGVSMLIAELLRRGAHEADNDPPTLDATTTRNVWGRYPIRFNG